MREECEVYLARHVRDVRLRGARVVPLELESIDNLLRRLDDYRPDWVVHTAGIASVDQCEREPERAREANAVLARNIAEVTARLGLRLIHISTDHLFAGTRAWYREEDAPEPLNVYARTKLLAEQWVMQANPEALAIRTNFFGWGHAARHSLSDWILDGLAAGRILSMFEDFHFTPILIDRLALAAHRLIAMGHSGIFHLAGDERVSKHEFAVRLARHFALPGTGIRRGKILEAKLAAPRPPDMSLDNAKARAALGSGLGTLDEYFDALRDQQQSGRRAELLQAVNAD